ncbi:MAG: ABC transporter ATP-binding protein [Alphaproteobacteria bacterium]|nr:ABC transporter ATP-binding protein [Alphaproteobacteria bacterium]
MIAARSLSLRRGARLVVQEASLALLAGEVLALVGPNGAGKSTLLKGLAGLMRPHAGSVEWEGGPLARLGARTRARLIGYLPQQPLSHWPIRVRDLVALGRLPYRAAFAGESAADRDAIENAMDEADLGHLAGRRVDGLSAGERARAMIGRMLASEPRLLLADEPVAALDPYHQIETMEILRNRAQAGAGVIVVLHDLGLAARFADRVALMREGRIAALGQPGLVLDERAIANAFSVQAAMIEVEGTRIPLPWRRITERRS